MNPYLITSLIFGVLLCIVWFVTRLKTTVYLPNMSEDAQEDVETRKKKVEKIRARRFIYGVGGVIVLCLLTYAAIALSGPAKKVHAALYPSPTPTATNTPLATSTPTITNTPRFSPTPNAARTQTGLYSTGSPAPTKSLSPSGGSSLSSGGGGGGSVTVYQTRLVVQTRIIYVIHTVIVTQTFTPTQVTETATITTTATETTTETPSPTATETQTVTPTHTPTQTETETLMP